MNPYGYRAWINHLVRRGNIVIYPRYQASALSPPAQYNASALGAVKAAFQELAGGRHVKPQLDHVAAVGHSAGGNIVASIAAVAARSGLPPFKAVFCVMPGKSENEFERMRIPLGDLSTMPVSTLLLALVGDRDTVVEDTDARRIMKESKLVPPQNKNLLLMVSDSHGEPPLIADHIAPLCQAGKYSDTDVDKGDSIDFKQMSALFQIHDQHAGIVDSLDFYGTWRLLDALCDAAFYGRNRDYALGNTPQQRFMGKWSDGMPVKELQVH